MRKPIFIDRDGVLNRDITPYVSHLEHLEIFPYTVQALKLLHDAGYDIFVVSNQQGVSLGITPQEELDKMVDAIQAELAKEGFSIKKFYHCTFHNRENHPWRKPSPGMILSACEEHGYSPEGAYLIGDKWSDIEAGARAGCKTILVLSGVTADRKEWEGWKYPPDHVFPTLLQAAHFVVSE